MRACNYPTVIFSSMSRVASVSPNLPPTLPSPPRSISSKTGQPVSGNTVFFGEVGLSGEIRTVSQPDVRLKEAAKLGFERAMVPSPPKRKADKPTKTAAHPLNVQQIDHLDDLVAVLSIPNSAQARRAA